MRLKRSEPARATTVRDLVLGDRSWLNETIAREMHLARVLVARLLDRSSETAGLLGDVLRRL